MSLSHFCCPSELYGFTTLAQTIVRSLWKRLRIASPKLQTAGLNLSVSADSVIVPHDASKSRLYEAISYTGDPKMPPSGKLVDGDIAKIRQWIEMGAPWPKAAGAPDRAQGGGRQITAADRQ